MEEFDTEIQKCVIKCQWEVNKEERISEQKRVMEEASKDGEETKAAEEETDTNSMDFRNFRATQFKNNKRVVLPLPGDDNEEIRRNNLKSELRKVVMKYKNENCDTFGNILDNNLSKTELK